MIYELRGKAVAQNMRAHIGRRRLHARAEVETWLQRHLLLLVEQRVGEERFAAAVEAVLRREKDPATAAQELLAPLLKP